MKLALGIVAGLGAILVHGRCLGASPPERASPAARPNILWITAEDMSPNLGCYGDSFARTPHVDALARAGVRYTRAFATAPVCSPIMAPVTTSNRDCSSVFMVLTMSFVASAM